MRTRPAMSARAPHSRIDRPIARAGFDMAIVLALAALFRLPALAADFWFDEIYSYERFARHARSVADIFFSAALKHDNNHHLNTLALYLLGDQSNWIIYRLPGAVAGMAAVAAAMSIGRRRSRIEGLVTGVLAATSFLVVVYSTEARGYAWLLAFAAIGFLALDRFLASGGRSSLAIFWLSIVAGLAAHPAILHFYLGALLWSGFRLRSRPRELVRLHVVPVAWIAIWLLVVTRGSVVGGGPPWTWPRIGDEALAWTLGYPLSTVPVAIAGGIALALVLWDAWRLQAEESDEWLFSLGTIVGPIVLMAALSPPLLFPRYFLVPLFFLLPVIGRRLAALAQTFPGGRWAAGAIVIAFVIGNGVHVATFARERHGNHVAALQMIAGAADHVTVSSWSLDQWTELPLAFYSPRLGLDRRVTYVPRADLASRPADAPRIDWALEVSQPCTPPTEPRRVLPGTNDTYVLVGSFPVCGPSGMSWLVYARERSGP